MTEELRFDGKLTSATVKKRAGRWFVSIAVETADVSKRHASGAVGVDLGIKTLATLSDGTVFENPKTYYKYDKQLRRAQESLSRKKKGSKNRAKAKLKLSKLYYRINCVVDDYIHKMTRHVANNYHTADRQFESDSRLVVNTPIYYGKSGIFIGGVAESG